MHHPHRMVTASLLSPCEAPRGARVHTGCQDDPLSEGLASGGQVPAAS